MRDDHITKAIEKHAIQAHPEECVGYVSENQYHRLTNISKVPQNTFRLSLADKFKLLNLQAEGKLTALVHSHPVLDNTPSVVDRGAAKATGYKYWLIGTDGKSTTDILEF